MAGELPKCLPSGREFHLGWGRSRIAEMKAGVLYRDRKTNEIAWRSQGVCRVHALRENLIYIPDWRCKQNNESPSPGTSSFHVEAGSDLSTWIITELCHRLSEARRFQDMYRLNGQYPVWELIQIAIRGPALIQRSARPIGW